MTGEHDTLRKAGGLIKRLRSVRFVRDGRDEQDYVCELDCDAEDYGARPIPRNQDGPEAADALTVLLAENAKLREALERALWYVEDHDGSQPNEETTADLAIIRSALLKEG